MSSPVNGLYEFGPYRMEVAKRALTREGASVALAPKTFDLLVLFVESQGRVLTKRELLNALWPDTFVEEASLSYQVAILRKALEEKGDEWIETVPKHGYRFTAPVTLLSSAPEPAAPSPVVSARRSSLVPWAVAALATLAALVLGWLYIHQTPSSERTIRLLVSPPEKETFWSYDSPAVSPDGEKLAFTVVDSGGKTRIWVRSLDSLTISPLAGADGGISPFWSPDSRSIAFFADRKLKKADLRGGPPQTLCDSGDLRPFGTWGRDGVILLGNIVGNLNAAGTLLRVAATGGEVTRATILDVSRQEVRHGYPQFLPDGRHFIYLVDSARPENTGIYAGSLDSKETKRLVSTQTNAAYAGSPSGSGYLLFTRDDALMAQAFDATRLELTGAPLLVTQPVSISTLQIRSLAAFSVSGNGVLAHRAGGNTGAKELVWFDRQGKRLGTVGEPADYSNPALSPDEKRLVVCRVNPQVRTRDL